MYEEGLRFMALKEGAKDLLEVKACEPVFHCDNKESNLFDHSNEGTDVVRHVRW